MTEQPNKASVFPNGTTLKNFMIDRLIGEGGYGHIYLCHDINKTLSYAMKVEPRASKKRTLKLECEVMPMLQGSIYFPKLITHFKNQTDRIIVMELFGPSLSAVRTLLPDSHFTGYTVTKLALEMLNAIEDFHKRGYVHRDIKPGNFLIRGNREHPIVLIDFGLARRFRDKLTGDLIPPSEDTGFTGTCRYASINAHEHKELGRGDDLVSWIYTVIELSEGALPWPGSRDRHETARLKKTLTPAEVCSPLPGCFLQIYNHVSKLEYADTPNYQFMRNLLSDLLKKAKPTPFDWEALDPAQIDEISAVSITMEPLNPDPNCCFVC